MPGSRSSTGSSPATPNAGTRSAANAARVLDVPGQLNLTAAVQATGTGYVFVGNLGPTPDQDWIVSWEDYGAPGAEARFSVGDRTTEDGAVQWPLFFQLTAQSARKYVGKAEIKSGELSLRLLDPDDNLALGAMSQCGLVVQSAEDKHHVQLSLAESMEPITLDFEKSKQTVSLGHVPMLATVPDIRLELEITQVLAGAQQLEIPSSARAKCDEELVIPLDASLQCELGLSLVRTTDDIELTLAPRYQRSTRKLPMAPSKLERELARAKTQLLRNQRDLAEAQLAVRQLPSQIARLNSTVARSAPEIAYKQSQLSQMNSRLNAAQSRIRRLAEVNPEMESDVDRMGKILNLAKGLVGQTKIQFRILAHSDSGSFVILEGSA